jgi:hypothetical protein
VILKVSSCAFVFPNFTTPNDKSGATVIVDTKKTLIN